VSAEEADTLRRLAARIERAGLRSPAALFLDALTPIDVINSQLARFGMPLAQGTFAEPVLRALADVEGWRELRGMLAEHEPPPR
jgi:hypothetical protein